MSVFEVFSHLGLLSLIWTHSYIFKGTFSSSYKNTHEECWLNDEGGHCWRIILEKFFLVLNESQPNLVKMSSHFCSFRISLDHFLLVWLFCAQMFSLSQLVLPFCWFQQCFALPVILKYLWKSFVSHTLTLSLSLSCSEAVVKRKCARVFVKDTSRRNRVRPTRSQSAYSLLMSPCLSRNSKHTLSSQLFTSKRH